jgi:hypothetical protein
MNHLFLSVCILIGILAGTYMSLSAAENTTVTILSPHDGETVTDTFILTYEILNGRKENHPQIFLDGLYLKEFDGTFVHLPNGEHTITVKVDGQDPHGTEHASDTIKIRVAK